ncbi:hypothetical protein HU200_052232 [Digitaria exilis]|uniref:Uncharacterized protein n=1 Tax=Digitaria exilis TaxID=1010633 RepID=A0A835APB6_9POAL|nr:hypothetical protein HU200_052232 [Digitaria exilis]
MPITQNVWESLGISIEPGTTDSLVSSGMSSLYQNKLL